MVIAVNNAGITATDYVAFNVVEVPVSGLSIQTLIDMVDSMYLDGRIDNQGIWNSLRNKLLTALDDFNDGDYEDAIEHLETFTSHVEAQQGKHIDTDAAQELLDYTADLIEHLSGL